MYRLPGGGAKKRLVTSIALALLALVVLWLGFRGSPPQSARDFEECVEQVQANPPSNGERSGLLTDCNARFAGRRKAGGGYTYYDFMQDRKFEIAGPNPTPEERKQIDRAYMGFLDGNGAMLIRLNWLKDRTNSCGQIWKARVSLSGHRWFSPRRIYLPQPQNGRSIDRNRRAVKMVHYLAAGQSFPRS